MTTDDCFFYPATPSCLKTTSTTSSNDDTHLYQEVMIPQIGQITFTIIAAQALTYTYFNMFIWRKNDFSSIYFDGRNLTPKRVEKESANYKMGKLIYEYGWLVLWSAALLTQLMSDFGMGAELNTKVWIMGIGVGGMLINLVTNVLWYS